MRGHSKCQGTFVQGLLPFLHILDWKDLQIFRFPQKQDPGKVLVLHGQEKQITGGGEGVWRFETQALNITCLAAKAANKYVQTPVWRMRSSALGGSCADSTSWKSLQAPSESHAR